MRGHEAIIAARLRGWKPAKWVVVDVGRDATWHDWLLKWSGIEIAPHLPSTTYVCLAPSDSTRLADWGWAIGLKVQVDGDDEARVMAACECLRAAGAARVVALLCDRIMEVRP